MTANLEVGAMPQAGAPGLKLEHASESPRGLGKTWMAGPHLGRSGVSLRIHVSNKRPGDADAVGPGPRSENHEAHRGVVLKPGAAGDSPAGPSRDKPESLGRGPGVYFRAPADSTGHSVTTSTRLNRDKGKI